MSQSPAAAMWDERYGKDDEFVYGTEPNDFLKEQFPVIMSSLPPKAKCLFLAEGEGRNAVYVASRGHDVTMVDISQAGLDKAQRLAKSKAVTGTLTTVLADLGEYDLGTSQWDLIVGISCHFPPPIRERLFQVIPPSLTPSGYLLLECYTPQQLELKTGGPPVPEMMYTADMLAQHLASSLTIERNEELVRDVVEGKYHTGKGAVVQFIAKKEG